MRLKSTIALLAAAVLSTSCGGALAGGTINFTKPTIAPDPVYEFGVVACAVQVAAPAPCPQPIVGAKIEVQHLDGWVYSIANGDGYALMNATIPYSAVRVSAVGFQTLSASIEPPKIDKTNLIYSLTPLLPQPVARSPLVLEPNDPTGLPCPHQQIVTMPSGPDRRFWRTDAWGVTVPGAPFVDGGNARHPERILSWFIDRYPLEWQTTILNANRARGYTHFTLSMPDSRDGAGQSPEQFAQTALRVNASIPFVHVMLTSKYFDPANADAPTRMAAVSPYIDALIAHGFTGDNLILGVGWELDLFNEGQKLEDFIHALRAKYPQFDKYAHFTTYKTSWQPDGKPRAQFWEATLGELTGLLYQGNPSDACGLMAAHFNDAQIPPSGLQAAGAVLVPWELVAESEYDNDHPNEDEANARAWSIMQTPGAILAAGAGNGWRFPDGRPALAAYPVKP